MSDQNSSNRVSWSSSVSKREYRNLDKVDRKNDDRKSFKHGDDGPSKRKRSPERDYSSSSRSKKISKDSRLERSHEHSRGEGRSSRKSDRDEDEKSSRHGENGTSKRKRSPDRDHSSSRSKKSSKDSRTERSHEHSRSKGRSSRRNDKEEEKDPYEGLTEEEKMAKMMGFTTFDTTKGKPVTGNNIGAVHILHKRKYRQYMNRKGGFNRPLDFVA